METTFGEWVRWTLARRGMDRAEVAGKLECDPKTVTNLYKRSEPDGVSDVILSRLAGLLGMPEPELMIRWKDGLPAPDAKPPGKAKSKHKGP